MSRQAGLFYRTSLFEEVTINLPDRKTFVIRTHNNSKTNKYIESVLLNGKPLDVPFFTHNDIVRGGNDGDYHELRTDGMGKTDKELKSIT